MKKKKPNTDFDSANLKAQLMAYLVPKYKLNFTQYERIFAEAFVEHEDKDEIISKAESLAAMVRYCIINQ